jgi:AcrR family transcriptional regulator
MAAATQTVRRRRTQAERREETRTALLDATIECLVTYGYAKTTTGRVAELAGVSRGAQTSYFRSRAELVGAAIGHLAEQRIESVRQAREVEAALGPKAGPGFTDDLFFALATIRGLALLRISGGGSGRALAELWEQTRERLVRLLA